MDTTDTNDPKVSKLTSVPLGNLIGAPLLAIVQGQTQAAQATAEFIERIGFDDTDAPPGQLGKLRTVTFSYQKNVENNEVQTFKVEIPLLSMVTVPGIQVSNASLEYSIKVADIQSTKTTTALSSEATGSSWLAPKRVEFNSTIGSLENTRSSVQTSLQMKIKMQVEQAPVPGGLSFLYNLMEQSVQQSLVSSTGQGTRQQ